MLHNSSIKVESLLGEGLNAHVYRAVSGSKEFGISKTYALKVLKRKGDLNHFKKEFAALSKAEGNHLVKLYGWKKHKGKPGLLLEYIEGINLETLLIDSTLSDAESNWIYHETLKGLMELNSHDLYHGDLSPKNIMITREGNIKLIDFGLTMWRTKQIEVTPEFASPEILDGSTPTFKHDFFSLNKIFESFHLFNSQISPISKPESLGYKVSLILSPKLQTKPIKSNPEKSSGLKIKAFALLFYSLAFFKPVSAQNINPKPSMIHLRSSQWMSVKISEDQEWCFTPCSLKISHLGLNRIYWKSQTASGSTQVFVDKDGQTLQVK